MAALSKSFKKHKSLTQEFLLNSKESSVFNRGGSHNCFYPTKRSPLPLAVLKVHPIPPSNYFLGV